MKENRLFPRILIFWGLHLAMAALGALAMGISQHFFAGELANLLSLLSGITVTLLYFLFFFKASKRTLSPGEGLSFSLWGSLPLVLLILGALVYKNQVPHNFIGYGFILLAVTLPFQGWIEHVFPAVPFHVSAMSVPVVMFAAIWAGSFFSKRGG